MNVVDAEFVAVGVPVIAPDALTERPAGSDEPLLTLNVYGAVPPDAASCPPEYTWSTVPLGKVKVVIVTAVTLALIVNE